MNTHRVAAIQMTSSSQLDVNLIHADRLITQAASSEARLVVLPENFALMSKQDDDKLGIQESLGQGSIQTFLSHQAKKNNIWLVGGSIPITSPDLLRPYNACLVYNNLGEQIACYRKIHLFDVDVIPGLETYQESSTAYPGNDICVIPTPFGKLGIGICYDLRFPEFFRAMLQQGAEIIALPAAFTAKTGQAHWEILSRARAIENLSYFIGACQTGTHDNGRQTYGHSIIINPWGEIMAVQSQGEGIIYADISMDDLQRIRKNFPAIGHRKI